MVTSDLAVTSQVPCAARVLALVTTLCHAPYWRFLAWPGLQDVAFSKNMLRRGRFHTAQLAFRLACTVTISMDFDYIGLGFEYAYSKDPVDVTEKKLNKLVELACSREDSEEIAELVNEIICDDMDSFYSDDSEVLVVRDSRGEDYYRSYDSPIDAVSDAKEGLTVTEWTDVIMTALQERGLGIEAKTALQGEN